MRIVIIGLAVVTSDSFQDPPNGVKAELINLD